MVIYDSIDLAKLLRLKERTVRLYMRKGKLPGIKLSGRWYCSDDLLKELFAGTRTPIQQASK